jgi:hypothetical protein
MLGQKMVLADGTEIHPIHFAFRHPDDGTWRLACTPGLKELYAHGSREHPYQRSDDSRAVNCPMCKETLLFRNDIAVQPELGRARR